MKQFGIIKYLLFLLLLVISNVNSFAQDDYVINKPSKKKAKNILFSKIENPDYTNYFLTSSAYTLKSRDIRISGTDIIFVKDSYGLTNNITASLNASMFGSLIASIKYKIDLNEELKLGFSAGLGQITTISEDSVIAIGGGQTMVTYGDYQDNITAGAGIYYDRSTFDFGNGKEELPLLNFYVGLQKQISRRVYLMADGIYFPEHNVFTGGFGVKIIIKDYMSLLVGAMPLTQQYLYTNNRQIRESIILPIVSFRVWLDRH